jgi:hypothetical protein
MNVLLKKMKLSIIHEDKNENTLVIKVISGSPLF